MVVFAVIEGILSMNKRNSKGEGGGGKTEPCGTLDDTGSHTDTHVLELSFVLPGSTKIPNSVVTLAAGRVILYAPICSTGTLFNAFWKFQVYEIHHIPVF